MHFVISIQKVRPLLFFSNSAQFSYSLYFEFIVFPICRGTRLFNELSHSLVLCIEKYLFTYRALYRKSGKGEIAPVQERCELRTHKMLPSLLPAQFWKYHRCRWNVFEIRTLLLQRALDWFRRGLRKYM